MKKYNESKEIIDGITVVKQYPAEDLTLYRYREPTTYAFDSLVKNEIWASVPIAFNDPYDSTVTINRSKMFRYLSSEIDDKSLNRLFNDFEIKNNNKKTKINNLIDIMYQENVKTLKSNVIVACFSQTVDNEVMWSHYAKNASGFAIEYLYHDINVLRDYWISIYEQWVNEMNQITQNIKDLEIDTEYNKKIYKIAKVVPSNMKYDITDKLIDLSDYLLKSTSQINIYQQIYNFIKEKYSKIDMQNLSDSIYFTKKKIWKYEKEWRLVLPKIIDYSDYNRLYFNLELRVPPVAIYLGEYAETSTKIIVYNYCFISGVPLYEMYSTATTTTVKLKKRKIAPNDIKAFLNDIGS